MMAHIPSPALMYGRYPQVARGRDAQLCLLEAWLSGVAANLGHRACQAQAPPIDVPGARAYSPPRSQEDFTQTDSFRMFSFKVRSARRRGLAPVSMLGELARGLPGAQPFPKRKRVAGTS